MKDKRVLIAGLVLIVFLVLIGGVGFWLFGKKGNKEVALPTPTPEFWIETKLEDRPFLSLTPSEDGHWLNLVVSRIKEAESLEYELSYATSEGVVQGSVGGPYSLQDGNSFEKKILLGSQSSGHFYYHLGVKKGNVSIRLNGGPGPRKFVSEFRLYQGEDTLSFDDGIFSLEGGLVASQFYLVMNTSGLPAEIEETVVKGPYGVFTSGKTKVKSSQLKLEGSEGEKIKIWSQEGWLEVEKNVVSEIGIFVLVSPGNPS